MIEIVPAQIPEDVPVVRQLFLEYAKGLSIDLCFQNFEAELASLPVKYAPPQGRLMLAWDGGKAVGCEALRPIDDDVCEMKRLYVQPGARNQQLGHRLAECICHEARDSGYHRICLDTLPAMSSAIHIYSALGVKHVEPYVFNPIEGALFFSLDL